MTSTTVTSTTGDIAMQGCSFQPKELTVDPGQKVSVFNRDRVAHDVRGDGTGEAGFQLAALSGGASGAMTAPMTPGRYPYACTFHPDMHGVLIVR